MPRPRPLTPRQRVRRPRVTSMAISPPRSPWRPLRSAGTSLPGWPASWRLGGPGSVGSNRAPSVRATTKNPGHGAEGHSPPRAIDADGAELKLPAPEDTRSEEAIACSSHWSSCGSPQRFSRHPAQRRTDVVSHRRRRVCSGGTETSPIRWVTFHPDRLFSGLGSDGRGAASACLPGIHELRRGRDHEAPRVGTEWRGVGTWPSEPTEQASPSSRAAPGAGRSRRA
jgi:hypothetical protein